MKLRLIVIFLAAAFFTSAQNGYFLPLEGGLRVYELENYTRVLVDSSGKLTLQDIRQQDTGWSIVPVEKLTGTGEKHWRYWLRIDLKARDSVHDGMIVLKSPDSISRYYAANRKVDAFLFKNGEEDFVHYKTGAVVPASQRALPAHPYLNTFPIYVAAGDSVRLYIRIEANPDRPAGLIAELRPQSLSVPPQVGSMNNLLSFSMGVTGILGLLCFFFFIAAGDRSYFYFALTCVCLGLHYTILHPDLLFVEWFIPEKPWLVEPAWTLLTHIIFIFFTLFGRAFTGLRRHSRTLDNLMLAVAAGIFFHMILGLSTAEASSYLPYPVLPLLFIILILISIHIGFFPGKMFKIFAAGAFWLLLFSVLGIFANHGKFTWFNPWPVGQLGLMIIYTSGLAYKFRLQEKDRAAANKVLELDAVKSRFFANISHEFRTPLTLILGPLRKAQERQPAASGNGEQEISIPSRHISLMRRNAERLEQLIHQLLDLSKLESGSMKLKMEAGDVVKYIKTWVSSFEGLAGEKQIHFRTEFPPLHHLVYFDRDKLEKIFFNLLSNAFKYTPACGYVSVKVLLENNWLRIFVENSGDGVPGSDLDKIFEYFYQVEGTEDKGTGIGLCLIKELVDLHQGQITVKSEPGKKTVFQVNLPVDKAAFDTKSLLADKPVATGQLPAMVAGYPETYSLENVLPPAADVPEVLVVEDNMDLLHFLKECLGSEFRVRIAKNGRDGFQAAIESIPDLVISDVMMPGMDGMQLCEAIKKDEHTSHIPVILLTAKAGQAFKIDGLSAGADVYMTKPFNEKELLLQAKNLIAQRAKMYEHFNTLSDRSSKAELKPASVSVTSVEETFLNNVTSVLEENIDNEFFSVEDLAKAVAFSRSQLHRKLKALTGKSPNELIREFRLTRAKELLEQGVGNVSEIAIGVGYSSLSYFTRSFKAEYGVLPSEI